MRLSALLLTLAIVLPVTQRVYALDSADEWDQQVESNGTITLTDDTILIQGSNNAGPGYPWLNTVTSLTTSSSIGETVSFGWAYWTTDGAYYDQAQMLLNESWVDLAIWNQGGYNAQQQSGSQEVYVTAGGIFGFRILSVDSCCGAGFLQINNTTWVVGSPEPSPSPTPTQTPEAPSPSPSVAPTPTPEPSVEPTPEPPPTAEPTPEPTPIPTAPPPSVAPTQEPTNEPTPNPTATPQPTPEGTVEPSVPPSPPPSPDPTAVPPPEPTQPPLPNLEEVAAAVEEAVGESIAAIGGGIADIAAIGEIGKDLDPTEKQEAQPMAVAVISSQIAGVAAAAARGGGSTPSGGNLGGGGGGGADAPKTRKTSSRKEQK